MRFKPFVAAVLLAAALPAFARSYSAGPSPIVDETNWFDFIGIPFAAGASPFADSFEFNLSNSMALDTAGAFTARFTPKATTMFNLNVTSLQLFDSANLEFTPAAPVSSFGATFANLPQGRYHIRAWAAR